MRTTLALHAHALPRIFTLLGCGLATTLSVSAANLTWTAAVTGTWDGTTLNWFNGSTSTAFHTGDNVTFDDTAATSSVFLSSAMAPGSVVVNTGVIYSFTGAAITGNGGLTKFGTGKVNLANTNLYTGNTIINGGTVALVSNGSISNSATIGVALGTTLDASGRSDGTLTLASGQTLTGSGSVHGTVTTVAGSVVAPGAGGIGTLTVNSNLNLGGNVVIEVSGSTLLNDLITGINHVNYGGTLTVSNLGGALAAGESFTLFGFSSFAGNFTSILGTPGSGLAYSFDPSTGVLSVNSTTPAYSNNALVNTVNGRLITIHFDDLVDPATGTNTDHYAVYTKSFSSSTVNVTNAVLQSDEQTVALYLDAPAGEFFAVAATNVLDTATNPLNAIATGYTGRTATVTIGTNGDPVAGEAIPIFNDTFTVTADGSDIGSTNDHCQFVFQPVVGDFEMVAQVTRLDNSSPNAKAGLMARENNSPGSRSLGVYITPPTSSGLAPSNLVLTLYRSATNGGANAFSTTINTSSSLNWLRLTRTNNFFTAYYGSNGIAWTSVGSVSQAWSGTTFAGLATTSNTNGKATTAGFNSYGVSGGRPGDGIVPMLKAFIVQKTNLVVNWQRTPHDFAVQIATNLVQDTNSSGGSNSIPQWGFVMLPVFDTSLTGTNSTTPPSGRYMTIPMDLLSGGPMFVRLAQVERVIPDPIMATPGIVFSLASSNLVKTAAAGTLCSDSINTTSVVTQNGTAVICPGGHVYQFTTASSGSSLHTTLQVRNLKTLGIMGCDGTYTAGSYKAQVTFTNATGSTATNYTFVSAATLTGATATPTCPVLVTVNIPF